MRLRAIVLVSLILLGAVAHPALAVTWRWFGNHYSEEPSWHARSFNMSADQIHLRLGVASTGEYAAILVALYDSDEDLLWNVMYADARGKAIDVASDVGGLDVSSDAWPGLSYSSSFEVDVRIVCNEHCPADRSFKLAVAGVGDIDAWGYGMWTGGFATLHATTQGNDVWAASSRDFGGTLVHATALGAGVSVVQDASVSFDATDTLLGGFVKPSSLRPERMVAQTPNGAFECDCVFADWPAGSYAFEYTDADRAGVEGYLALADVKLP